MEAARWCREAAAVTAAVASSSSRGAVAQQPGRLCRPSLRGSAGTRSPAANCQARTQAAAAAACAEAQPVGAQGGGAASTAPAAVLLRAPNSLSVEESAGALDPPLLTAQLRAARTSERVLLLAQAHWVTGALNPTHTACALHALGDIASTRARGRRAAQQLMQDPRMQLLLRLAVHEEPGGCAPDAGHLASSLRGLALLRAQPLPTWQAAWERRAEALALDGRFPARELCGCAWSYATLHLRAGVAWQSAAEALTVRYAEANQLALPELAALFWASGREAAPPGRAARHALLQAASCAADGAAADQEALPPREVANILWGAASWQAGLAVSPAWAHSLLTACMPRLGDATPQELANIAWALAQLRALPPAPFWPLFERTAQPLLPSFEPRHLSAVATASTRLRWTPSDSWRAAFESAAARCAPQMQPHQAAALLRVWRAQRWRTPDQLLAAVQARAGPPAQASADQAPYSRPRRQGRAGREDPGVDRSSGIAEADAARTEAR